MNAKDLLQEQHVLKEHDVAPVYSFKEDNDADMKINNCEIVAWRKLTLDHFLTQLEIPMPYLDAVVR
ncbi:CLUMA_CG009567, isoform A [Clunio marinus]|uniref:CLUMA_CG009567, isoform A n=1 Tax=Clunio marinus TaxID=568069 RepID=A0A1J1ICH2_9DIPT|nr:CLUMA_CG009567, isoform A [Clunio marinus]